MVTSLREGIFLHKRFLRGACAWQEMLPSKTAMREANVRIFRGSVFRAVNAAEKTNRRCRYDCENHVGLHGVQAPQLCDQEEQANPPEQGRDDEALQVLPQAHAAQRNKVTGGAANGGKRKGRCAGLH